jgi:peptidoglycan hydrolase CwlO-like protein
MAGIIGLIFSGIGLRRNKRRENKTSEKIDHLSKILKDASSEIEALEDEVKTKSKRLQELDEHSKRLETLLSLKEEQVEAIRQELRTTLKENNRSNRIWTVLIGAFWFLFGLIVRGFLGF